MPRVLIYLSRSETVFIGHKQISYPSKSSKFDIAGIGDVHVGHTNFAREYFEKMMTWLYDQPNFYVLGMGDYFDEVTVKRRYYDVQQLDPDFSGMLDGKGPLKRVVEYVEKWFKPIAEEGRLLGFLEGNHDYVTTRESGYSYVMVMAESLGVPYLGHTTLYRLSFQRNNSQERSKLDIYATHGHFSGATVGGKITKLDKVAKDFDADVYMMGHVHDIVAYTRPQIRLNHKGELSERRQAFLVTGSFMRTYQEGHMGYGEPSMYSPTKIGFPKVKFWPHRRDLHVSE